MTVTFHVTPDIYERQPQGTAAPKVGDELKFHGVKCKVVSVEFEESSTLATLESI